MSKQTELFTCKRILIIIISLGFMLHHMLRINMSMAIVDMIINNNTDNNKKTLTQVRRYDWNEHQKNEILGCFFWSYCISSFISGHLSEIYGTRIVLGYGLVVATICTVLTPAASYSSYFCLLVVRIGVGFGLGMQWSSIMPLATKWIPPTDISKFMSTMLGCQIGAALTLVLCGYLINGLGWPSVFYVTGTIAAVWCAAWFYNIYDSPRQHPRISEEEQELLKQTVKYQISEEVRVKKPWAKIFSSRPVWVIIISYSCVLFNAHSSLNYTPLYMDRVINFDISDNGLFSSLPFIVTYFASILSSYLGDRWTKTHYFSVIAIRKIFTAGALFISALALTVQSIWGYNRAVSVVIFVIWQSSSGCHTAGCMPNAMDISPSYSGTILSLGAGLGGLLGYLSTKTVALLIKNEHSFQEWRTFFWILIAVNLIGAGIYCFFATADVQEWNNASRRIETEEEGDDAVELSAIDK